MRGQRILCRLAAHLASATGPTECDPTCGRHPNVRKLHCTDCKNFSPYTDRVPMNCKNADKCKHQTCYYMVHNR
jgi:hypothetical protein